MKFDFKMIMVLLLVMTSNALLAQRILTFEDILNTTKAHNPKLKSEKLQIEIAEADITSAETRPNLILSNETIQMSNASEFSPGTTWSNPQNREVLWQVSKEFQIMGQRRNKIDLATKTATLSSQEYLAYENSVLFEVAQKWNEVWTAQQQLKIIQMAKTNIDSLVIINQHRYKNQVVTKTDVLRAELLSKHYNLQYIAHRQELWTHRKELQLLMGTQDSIIIDTDQILDKPALISLENLQKETLSIKKEVKVAKSVIDLSESNVNFQKSMAYPQPEIGVIYNSQNKIPHFGIAASIELPFFDRNQGEIKKSLLLKDQAEQELQTLKHNLTTEIALTYDNYQTHFNAIKAYSSLLAQSQAILDNIKYAYLKGGTTIIDFLEAQRHWLEMQENYNDAQHNYRNSYIQLLHTTGLLNL